MPLRDLECPECGKVLENQLVKHNELIGCADCVTIMVPRISYAANYTISGDNSASCRPVKSKSTERKS